MRHVRRFAAPVAERPKRRSPHVLAAPTAATGGIVERTGRRRGLGNPLDGAVRRDLEHSLGTEIGPVSVHVDTAAAGLTDEVGARAFTVGNDVFFGAGAYQPESSRGFGLLAHEMAHVLQDQPGVARSPDTVSEPADPSEQEAEAVADAAVARRGLRTDPPALNPAARGVAAIGALMTLPGRMAAIHRGEPEPPPQPPIEPMHRDKRIATWIGFHDAAVQTLSAIGELPLAHYVEPVGAIPGSITPTGWTQGHYPSEAGAVAAIRAAGRAGAIFLEQGQYVAYHAVSKSLWYDFTSKNVRWFAEKPWTAVQFDKDSTPLTIVLDDGVALHAKHFKTKAEAQSTMTDEALMPGADGDPFAGYKATFGDLNKPGIIELVVYPAIRDYTLSVLHRSRRAAELHIARFSSAGAITPEEMELMRHTAEYLAGLDDELEKVPKTIPPDPDELAKFRDLGARRRVVLARYPMLSRVDPRTFVKLTVKQQKSALGLSMHLVIWDIDSTRDNILDDTLNLWKIPALVDSTIVGLGISDPVLRKRVKELAENSQSDVTQQILQFFTVVLGLASIVVDGPLGVAVAAGALGLGVADAVKQTEEILAEHAASNTNPDDPSKSILPPEDARSYGWLVLAWGGVIADSAQLLAAIKAVKAASGALEAGVKVLAKSEAVAKELRLVAGIADAGETVSQVNKAGLARRLGTSLEIDEKLVSDVRVYYHLDSEGRAVLDGVRCGPQATVGVIMAHESVVRLLRRYDGLLGRVRELIDKFLSLGTSKFATGSQAYESFLEVKKLPDVIAARRALLGTELTAKSEAALRRDIEFLENELARHHEVVDQMVAERGLGYVAAAGEETKAAMAATKPAAERMPDIFKHPRVRDPSKYYYYRNAKPPPPFLLRRFQNADVPSLNVVADGAGGWKLTEGALSRTEEAAAMVGGWNQGLRNAFDSVKTAFQKGVFKVVPLRGVAATGKKIRDLMTGGQQAELYEVLIKAFSASGKEADPAARATAAMTKLLEHDITLVRGTDQLRAYNYRLAFEKLTGEAAEGDLHHLIPLYLGGDNKALIDVAGGLHNDLHRIVDQVKLAEGVTLAPGSIGQGAGLSFSEGAAVLFDDGRVQLVKLLEDGTYGLVP